jgi:hypothetical protein
MGLASYLASSQIPGHVYRAVRDSGDESDARLRARAAARPDNPVLGVAAALTHPLENRVIGLAAELATYAAMVHGAAVSLVGRPLNEYADQTFASNQVYALSVIAAGMLSRALIRGGREVYQKHQQNTR